MGESKAKTMGGGRVVVLTVLGRGKHPEEAWLNVAMIPRKTDEHALGWQEG